MSDRRRLAEFAVLIFAYVLLSATAGRIVPEQMEDAVATVTFFAVLFLMYVTVALFLDREGGGSVSTLGLQQDGKAVQQISAGVLAGVGAAMSVTLLAILLGGQLRPASDVTAGLLISTASIAVIVSFVEELTYRGYLLTRMEKCLGQRLAIVGSSVFFSLMHFSWWTPPYQVPPYLVAMFTANIFVGGCTLALAYYWSGRRLWAPMAFHASWNVVAYALFPIYPRENVTQVILTQIEWGATTLVGFAIGIILLWLLLTEGEKQV